jgi:hypothetical protein
MNPLMPFRIWRFGISRERAATLSFHREGYPSERWRRLFGPLWIRTYYRRVATLKAGSTYGFWVGALVDAGPRLYRVTAVDPSRGLVTMERLTWLERLAANLSEIPPPTNRAIPQNSPIT